MALKEFLEKLANNMNTKAMDAVKKWIGDRYYGKIIQFQVGDLNGFSKAYYFVFTKKGVKLKEGDYPSPELILRSDEETLQGIIEGKVKVSTVRDQWKLLIIGNAHDQFPFMRIATSVLL
ncbi:MAG: SCP2 sterol-binding domain-containing protein [Candidatus Jordarchaeum sp.]|uniref:SCP2 sterol-binding domain-containing protein n=1 Tax=Candidatus Jordarchaeum sp. TaxID=2823881 RepID=UPI0040495A34